MLRITASSEVEKINTKGATLAESLDAAPVWWTGDEWATPPSLVHELEKVFGQFELDPCCRILTAKAPEFCTLEDDGLSVPWWGRVWLNPPYSNPAPWLDKAGREVEHPGCDLVVALLPARTDTQWFHELVLPKAEVCFLRGRVAWLGWAGRPIGRSKDPSILAVYGADREPGRLWNLPFQTDRFDF